MTEQEKAIMIFEDSNTEKYERNLSALKWLYKNYRMLEANTPARQSLDIAMTIYARLYTDNQSKRKYEAFKAMYIYPESTNIKKISEDNFTHKRTVWKDIDDVVKELMIIIFGIDGIKQPDVRALAKIMLWGGECGNG
jgi:hypothetical protein